MEKITFNPGGDEAVEFYVLAQTRLGGFDYILVTDSEDGDGDAMILKDVSEPTESQAVYEAVTEDEELHAVGSLFSEILEDEDIDLTQ
ncbi:MAG: DUF1292 domain-containing protein [Lachnospiraceae bacterium]|jgi:hypothetical protein|nr:DUF1292 domain-containing protein [Lachnospiraceae bacterium]